MYLSQVSEGHDVKAAEAVVSALYSAYPKAAHLLTRRWRFENEKSSEPSTGFCYIGAEAAYHALGGRQAGWVPRCASYHDDGQRATHWWIERGGVKVDPTANQYLACGEQPPYHLGRSTGFLTKEPSRRTRELMQIAGI